MLRHNSLSKKKVDKIMNKKENFEKLQPYFFLRHKGKILTILIFLTLIFGFIGFSSLEESNKLTSFQIIINTLGLFVFEWDDKHNGYTVVATVLGMLTIFSALLSIFYSNLLNLWHLFIVPRKPYYLIIGLSEQNVSFLKKAYNTAIIIIEKDKNHPYFEYFKERGFAIKGGHRKEAIKSLNLNQMQHAIISTGNDRKNISLGKFLFDDIKKANNQNIHVCIQDRDLNILFKQNVINKHKRENINITTYSVHQNMVKNLFEEHSLLGEYGQIIKTKEPFSMVVVGDSNLAVELVYHIAFLSTLPHENPLTLYLMGANSNEFQSKIEQLFPEISKILHLTIKAINVPSKSLNFYRDDIWKGENLTNVMIATQNEEKNLNIAINLQDTTYIREIGHKKFKTKVLFALYHNQGLGKEIDRDEDGFKNFFTFGNIDETSTKEILLEDKLDLIAKLIHDDYKEEDDLNWVDISAHKREANVTQAMHIDIKLLAFGLKRVKSDKSVDELLEQNRKFYSILEGSKKIKQHLKNYKEAHFPISFDETLLDQVARSEHNRWNAFHFLNGWEYNPQREDNAKEHNCLQPLESFYTEESKLTYQYDIASVYYMPKYLALAGFEIEEV